MKKNELIKKIKNIIYAIGILCLFSLQVIFFYNVVNEDFNIYSLFLVICTLFSTCVMISKIIKSHDYLKRIQNIMNDNTDNDTKIERIGYEMYDINSFLND